jgi:predicted tellurium resistance membrane protein TerC
MENLFTTENAIAFLTLSLLEIVLGIDNVVFIAILSAKLPAHQQSRARKVGLAAAMVMRILLLFGITWVMGLKKELFSVMEHSVSGKDLVLILGGLFLLAKATYEIHDKLEAPGGHERSAKAIASFGAAIAQIMMLDIVFSIDSVITAVGMANHIGVMIAAVITAVAVMMIFANPICNFIERHPTMKMLALSFLLLIGVMLVAEGFGAHVGKGYIYFAMGFSLGVELLNLRFRKVHQPVHIHQATPPKS